MDLLFKLVPARPLLESPNRLLSIFEIIRAQEVPLSIAGKEMNVEGHPLGLVGPVNESH